MAIRSLSIVEIAHGPLSGHLAQVVGFSIHDTGDDDIGTVTILEVITLIDDQRLLFLAQHLKERTNDWNHMETFLEMAA